MATDYNILDNKPLINSVELIGNRTSEELGLATETKVVTSAIPIYTLASTQDNTIYKLGLLNSLEVTTFNDNYIGVIEFESGDIPTVLNLINAEWVNNYVPPIKKNKIYELMYNGNKVVLMEY